jgi:DNA-binding NarL/FixJ family response regulator
MSRAIRVLIADDHAVVVDGLRHLIDAEDDMEVVASAQDGEEAVRLTLGTKPDVVVMDHSMPIMDGIEAAGTIRDRHPETRVIMLSMHTDPVHVQRALRAGAAGYVAKRSAGSEVIDAIRAVIAGRRYVSKPLADSVVAQFVSENSRASPLSRLTARERQVLRMLGEGLNVKVIAAELSLSPKTVEAHRAKIMQKLEIRDLAGLVRFALRHGLAALD